MRKEDKLTIIEEIANTLKEYSCVYLAETNGLDAEKTSALRRECFKSDIKLVAVKNTLLKKAMEQSDVDYSGLYPALKAAFVEETVYMGADQLDFLANLKSKNELIADVVALLQSPAKNVISALQSSGNKLHGILETLSNKEE